MAAGLTSRHARQGGFAALVMIFILAALMAMVTGADFVGQFAKLVTDSRESDIQKMLDQAVHQTQIWYANNTSLDIQGSVVSEQTLLRTVLAEMSSRYAGLRAQMSTVQSKVINGSTVKYRTVAIWMGPPSDVDTTTWVNDNIVFDPTVLSSGLYRTWSSLSYQTTQVAQVSALLQRVQKRAQSWAQAQQAARGRGDNFLRQPVCSSDASAHYLPCLDSYTALSSTTLPTYFGLDSMDLQSTYGDYVQISNLDCSTEAGPLTCSTQRMPYTLSLRIKKPFETAYFYVTVEQAK